MQTHVTTRAKALGWFSLALGLTELVATKHLARALRLKTDKQTLSVLRAYGLREMAAGFGILSQPHRAAWIWSRVAGDAMDLAALAVARNNSDEPNGRIAGAAASVAGIAVLDAITGWQLQQESTPGQSAASMESVCKAITVKCKPEEAYAMWRKLENLPRFMAHLQSVQENDALHSHWVAKGPAGVQVSWDAEITQDIAGQRIAWRSTQGADVDNVGSVDFVGAPGDRGTEVRVNLKYGAPAGKLGKAVAKLLLSEPAQQINGDLRRFKQVMELGEVAHSDASIQPPLRSLV